MVKLTKFFCVFINILRNPGGEMLENPGDGILRNPGGAIFASS